MISQNLVGKQFGRLKVLKRIGSRHNKTLYLCGCRCGSYTEIISTCLTRKSKPTRTCGRCRSREKFKKEYTCWQDIIRRCGDKNFVHYKYYGGRGISVCDRWKYDFFNFLEDVGLSLPDEQIDRINNDGNYEPGNVRWTNKWIQMTNKTQNNQHTIKG